MNFYLFASDIETDCPGDKDGLHIPEDCVCEGGWTKRITAEEWLRWLTKKVQNADVE